MAPNETNLRFDRDFEARVGELVAVADGIARVTAPNASPYTFTGTNTYLIGQNELLVVDPGPDSSVHLDALLAAIAGRPVTGILLTHTHKDHSPLAPALAEKTGAPILSGGRHQLSRPRRLFEIDPVAASCDWAHRPDRTLSDGELVIGDGLTLMAVATPGHCRNHLAFGVVGAPYLLTGDHVMGWNSTLVSVPDGSMADYLKSLDKVIEGDWPVFLPAHAGPIADGRGYARALRAHRELRNRQIVAAVKDGANSLGRIVAKVYPQINTKLAIAARMTTKAHVEYLADKGLLFSRGGRVLVADRRAPK